MPEGDFYFGASAHLVTSQIPPQSGCRPRYWNGGSSNARSLRLCN